MTYCRLSWCFRIFVRTERYLPYTSTLIAGHVLEILKNFTTVGFACTFFYLNKTVARYTEHAANMRAAQICRLQHGFGQYKVRAVRVQVSIAR